MTDLLPRKGVVEDTVDEKARRAVQAFRALQPTLSTYARLLTGKPTVRVDLATHDNGSTDGERIFFRPPIALGDNTPHVRRDCDRRRSDGLMLCKACRVREEVLVTMYHEFAHICFDSFQVTSENDKRRAIEFSVKEAKGKWAKEIEARIRNAPSWQTKDYINLCSLINEYLPFLLNCMEDARVNRELFKVLTGVGSMFEADMAHTFNEGFEVADAALGSKIVSWKEAPLNNQVVIGVFCKASGYDYSDWFHPTAVAALDDSELTSLVDQMDSVKSVKEVYNLSFKVLARLRDLGFCGTPQDPDPEPEESDEPDADSGDGSPSGDSSGDKGDDVDEYDSVDDSDSDGADDSKSGNGDRPSNEDKVDESTPHDSGEDSSVETPEPSNGDESSDSSGDSEGAGDPSSDSDSGDSGSGSGDDQAGGEASSEVGLSEGNDLSSGDSGLPCDPGGQADSTDDPSDVGDSRRPESGSEVADGRGDEGESQPDDATSRGASSADDDSNLGPDAADSDNREDASEDHSSTSDHRGDSSDELIDTGADDGYGGTELLGQPDPPMGTVEDLEPIIKEWITHAEKPKSIQAQAEEQAVETAIIQGLYFTDNSRNVRGVIEHFAGKSSGRGWKRSQHAARRGQGAEIDIPEVVLQPALMRLRRIFTDNQRGRHSPNKKSGRINARVLGARAWSGDPRLFTKKTLPGKKNYLVILSVDISGSTVGKNILLEKRAVYAQAELLDRMGIPFVIVAHTAESTDSSSRFSKILDMHIYWIKDEKEPWNEETQHRLKNLGAVAYNLDGHALEFLRKLADKSKATDKIIMYYSDGKMPQENYQEELTILQREIKTCKAHNIMLMGVGIRTDSPRAHGLDTVQVDEDKDIEAVVKHLEKELSVRI